MSVLKNLKSIFVVEDEQTEEKTSDAKTTSKKEDKPTETTANNKKEPIPVKPLTEGKRDEKIINTLFKAIEKSNLNGFDYLEFKQSVKGLEKMVTDEATRFKSAFATASTMGVTMNKLVETAEYYAKILDKEKSEFVKAANNQSNALIDNRKKELQLLLKAMGDKKKMIEQLQEELKVSEQKIQQIQTGIDKATVKIDNTKKNFEVSFSYLKNQIVNDIDKIKTYLK